MVTKKGPLEIARELVRIESVNPPGHENECAQYIGKLMQDAGLQVNFYEFAEGRTGIVARLEGSGAKAPICFGGHVRTVPVPDWVRAKLDDWLAAAAIDRGKLFRRDEW